MKTDAALLKQIKKLETSLKRRYPAMVVGLRPALRTDSDGDDAVFVTVVLKDRKGDYEWEEVRPVARAIREKVFGEQSDRYPYVFVALESDENSAAAG